MAKTRTDIQVLALLEVIQDAASSTDQKLDASRQLIALKKVPRRVYRKQVKSSSSQATSVLGSK